MHELKVFDLFLRYFFFIITIYLENPKNSNNPMILSGFPYPSMNTFCYDCYECNKILITIYIINVLVYQGKYY